jgi:hypothetical protein
MYWVRESVTRYALPRATSSMPSETMNEGTRQATLIKPVTVPQRTPQTSPTAIAAGMFQPQDCMATALNPPASASTEPTERSMPPITRT